MPYAERPGWVSGPIVLGVLQDCVMSCVEIGAGRAFWLTSEIVSVQFLILA